MCLAGVSVPQVRELLWGNNPILGCILLGSLGIFTIGFLDDLARLAPKTKLIGEFVVAGLVVWGANLSFTEIQFLGLGSVSIPAWLRNWISDFLDRWNGQCRKPD